MLWEQSFEILSPLRPPKKQPLKELCCLFFVQLGNRYIIICSLSLCLCGNVCVYTCVAFSKNQSGAQISSFASITTVSNAVIVPFTIVRVSHLLFSLLPLEYTCSQKPLMFAALETNNTAMMMYSSARKSGKRGQQGCLGQRGGRLQSKMWEKKTKEPKVWNMKVLKSAND